MNTSNLGAGGLDAFARTLALDLDTLAPTLIQVRAAGSALHVAGRCWDEEFDLPSLLSPDPVAPPVLGAAWGEDHPQPITGIRGASLDVVTLMLISGIQDRILRETTEPWPRCGRGDHEHASGWVPLPNTAIAVEGTMRVWFGPQASPCVQLGEYLAPEQPGKR